MNSLLNAGKAPPHPFKRRLQMIYRRVVWGMDIDRSAVIATTAYIDRTWPKGIHIRPGAVIDEEAVILTHDMTRSVYLNTTIGAGSYIGPRAIILPGMKVGERAVVRAGSVVTRDVPEGTSVTGNPARAIEGSSAERPD